MNYTENEMKQILEQEVEIPKKVDERLQDTYSRIRSQNKTRTNYAKKSWRKITAAADVERAQDRASSASRSPHPHRNRRHSSGSLPFRAHGFLPGHVRKHHKIFPGTHPDPCGPG